jgi:hypothetical protein
MPDGDTEDTSELHAWQDSLFIMANSPKMDSLQEGAMHCAKQALVRSPNFDMNESRRSSSVSVVITLLWSRSTSGAKANASAGYMV